MITSYVNNPFSSENLGNISILNETPTPSPNGVVTTFTVSSAYISDSLQPFLDGLGQIKTTDFSETTSTTFTMVVAPASDETLWVNYIKS